MSKITVNQHKRVKVTLACIVCRKKKVKCDGIQPACSRCITLGNCCQYSDPPKKRGPPKGYVEVIENRAHRIESLLGSHHHQQRQQQQQPQQQQLQQRVDHHYQQQPKNELIYFISNAVTSIRNVTRIHGSYGTLYDFLMTENVFNHIFIDNFFHHFNFIFPVLSRPQFMIQFQNGEVNSLLKLAVFIMGSKFEGNQEQELMLYQQFPDDFVLLNSDISTLQAMVIMCWYTFIIGDLDKCYVFRHQLSRLLNQYLNQDSNHKDIYEVEMKKRVYWISFCIDQWISLTIGGQKFIHHQDYKLPRLEDNQLFVLKHNNCCQQENTIESVLQITSFHEMIKLSKIIYNLNIIGCKKTNEAKLTEWLLNLPCYLDFSKNDTTPLSKLYRILYYTTQTALYNSKDKDNLDKSICTTASNTIIHISDQMLNNHQEKYLYNVFFSSILLSTSIHLDNTITDRNEPDKINLLKSVSIIRKVNSSLLSAMEITQYILDRCGQLLLYSQEEQDTIYPSPTNSTSSLKRKYQQTSMVPPQVTNESATFDLSMMFSTPDAQQQQQQQQNSISDWSWIELFDNQTMDSSNTCSPASFITPYHSPSLSLRLKEEEFDLNQPFFTSFPTNL